MFLISTVTTFLIIAWCPTISSFSSTATISTGVSRCHKPITAMSSSSSSSQDNNHENIKNIPGNFIKRRSFIRSVSKTTSAALLGAWAHNPSPVNAATEKQLPSLLSQITKAKEQLSPVPSLIKDEKWDSVRAILITPPLSDCWAKSSASKPLLKNYATAIGDELPDGDELAALELREDLTSHLRFLDMAVYNNVFNPISTEGTTGATKELVRSYYEDPINEYKATLKALEELIQLAGN